MVVSATCVSTVTTQLFVTPLTLAVPSTILMEVVPANTTDLSLWSTVITVLFFTPLADWNSHGLSSEVAQDSDYPGLCRLLELRNVVYNDHFRLDSEVPNTPNLSLIHI